MALETHVKLCVTEPDFTEKKFWPLKWAKSGLKPCLFNFFLKVWSLIWHIFYNTNLYYLLCSCTNPIFGKIFVREIWAKMFIVNQIAGFFNQPYLQNKLMK